MFKIAITLLMMSSLYSKLADCYLITALPKNFKIWGRNSLLNNNGQVAGTIIKELLGKTIRNVDPEEGAKAAFWDPNKGLMVLEYDAYKTMSRCTNDNGIIVLSICKDKQLVQRQTPRVGLWDTAKNTIIIGPYGSALGISDENIILLDTLRVHHSDSESILWSPYDNTLVKVTALEQKHPYLSDCNARGSKIGQLSKEFTLDLGDKKSFILSFLDGEFEELPRLNDLDEVVALVRVSSSNGKQCHKITKWKNAQVMTLSEPLEGFIDLKDYVYFSISAFNNKGQILLKAAKPNNYASKLAHYDLFLLTPVS